MVEIDPAILLPAFFRVAGRARFFLPEAYGLDLVFAHTQEFQAFGHGISPTLTQGNVVFGTAALIAIAFQGNGIVGMCLDERSLLLHDISIFRLDDGLVKIEIDALVLERIEFIRQLLRVNLCLG